MAVNLPGEMTAQGSDFLRESRVVTQGFVDWQAGRGRGTRHSCSLTCCCDPCGKKNDMMSIQHQSSTTESRYYLLSIRGSLRIEGEKYDIQKTYVCRQVLYYML